MLTVNWRGIPAETDIQGEQMDFISKLERKYGRYAIRDLMKYFSVLYAAGFVISIWNQGFYYTYLSLDPAMILKGQIWRIVTFLVYPPSSSMIWGLLMLLLYYSLGLSLERAWGAFRFNLFMFTGVIFHIIAAFVIYFLFGRSGSQWMLTPDSLNTSIFLAYAITFPDMQFYLYFVIPVKAKYLGIFYAAVELIGFVVGGPAQKVTIFLSLFNVVLFFLLTRNWKRYSPHEIKRREDFKRDTRIVPVSRTETRHRCAVCGRTEKDGDNLEFRYCSKCKGNLEYCQDHLYTHKHVE
jgi:hypothetical protein